MIIERLFFAMSSLPIISVRSMMAGSCSSLAGSQDAPRRNTDKFFGTLKFGGKCVSIRAGWAAHDAPKLVASMASGIVPWSVIGHWPFDGKEPLIVVGDDEEEWCGLLAHAAPRHMSRMVATNNKTSSKRGETRSG